jgi:prepilin-type N-terminal cleavage/methylation domain-containing protein
MLRNKMSGFTLIELMVVIVIIGVLASLAIPRFTEASVKAKVAEAPRVIASFESGYLAAVAEVGEGSVTTGSLIFESPQSKWFNYGFTDDKKGTVTKDIGGLKAAAEQNMGVIVKTETFNSVYAGGPFSHSFSACPGEPNKPDPTDDKYKNDTSGDLLKADNDKYDRDAEAYKGKCNPIKKYVPNFM